MLTVPPQLCLKGEEISIPGYETAIPEYEIMNRQSKSHWFCFCNLTSERDPLQVLIDREAQTYNKVNFALTLAALNFNTKEL